MAKVVLGVGTSHGPMISTPPDQWHQRVAFDVKARHPFRGGEYSFNDLVSLRAAENFAAQITPDVWRKRYDACQTALEQLADAFEKARVDVAIIVGDDQNEVFSKDNSPEFFVYTGATISNEPASEAKRALMPPGVAIAEHGHKPPQRETYPCSPEFATHISSFLASRGLAIQHADRFPNEGSPWFTGAPHAYGFVYRNVMRDKVIPNVPFFINTFYPPTQPSAAQCVALGDLLVDAVNAWPEDARVAIIASGGLTHFVIDEAFDRRALDLMARADRTGLSRLPEDHLQSGNSEIKNWMPVASACEMARLQMQLVDYVPCYRSLAGTGTANAFALWQ